MSRSNTTPGSGPRTPSVAEGVLIDFTDEIKIPFPSQLMTTAEVDDTFGIFEESKWPVRTSNGSGVDCLSPALVHEQLESSFKMPTPLAMSEKILCANSTLNYNRNEGNKRKSVRKSIISGNQVLAGSASMLGLNDAFIGSTGSDSAVSGDVTANSCDQERSSSGSNSNMSAASDFSTRKLSTHNDSVFISPITVDDKGNTSDESGLLEIQNLSNFTISDCEISASTTPAPANESCIKNRSKSDSVPNMFVKVFEAASKNKQNDVIAKKVQEMFDAASPSKNSNLWNGSNHLSIGKHHFVPIVRRSIIPATTTPKVPESLFATPRRESARQFTPIQRDHDNETCFNTPSTPPHYRRDVDSTTPKPPIRLFRKVDMNETDCSVGSSLASPAQQKFNLNNSRLRTPTRLTFSSSSSSSGGEGTSSTKKLVKAFPGSTISAVAPKIQSGHAPRLRFGESGGNVEGTRKGPLKAMPIHQISGPAKNQREVLSAAKAGCASAPVHRKFIPPIAASSPKPNSSFTSYEPGTPQTKNKRLSNVRSSGYGQQSQQRAIIPESPRRMNTSTSRIPSSPLTTRGLPSPVRRPVTSSTASGELSLSIKRRNMSQTESSPTGRSSKTTKSGRTEQRSVTSGSTKENKPKIASKFGFRR